jgi:hypothetical protein
VSRDAKEAGVTNRGIVALALAATACLVLGARLLDGGTAGTVAVAVLAIIVGTVLAATAVAGAWRPMPRRPESGSVAD